MGRVLGRVARSARYIIIPSLTISNFRRGQVKYHLSAKLGRYKFSLKSLKKIDLANFTGKISGVVAINTGGMLRCIDLH